MFTNNRRGTSLRTRLRTRRALKRRTAAGRPDDDGSSSLDAIGQLLRQGSPENELVQPGSDDDGSSAGRRRQAEANFTTIARPCSRKGQRTALVLGGDLPNAFLSWGTTVRPSKMKESGARNWRPPWLRCWLHRYDCRHPNIGEARTNISRTITL